MLIWLSRAELLREIGPTDEDDVSTFTTAVLIIIVSHMKAL